jgi:hypothetical protein
MGNREKVWKAEERDKEDQKKLDELRRELAEERELEDMRRQRDSARGVERCGRWKWREFEEWRSRLFPFCLLLFVC